MTRKDWPVWHMPFPTLPTVSGRRPASRRAKRMEAKRQKDERFMRMGHSAATMCEHARIIALPSDAILSDGW